jgi:hypothetical protein
MYKYSGGISYVSDQKEFVREQFESYFEKIIKNRTEIKTPEQITLKWLALLQEHGQYLTILE